MIVITGQTATGKTNLALKYAQKYNGELINFDSRQVYKHLDIITGKDISSKNQYQLLKKINNFDIGYYQIEINQNQSQTFSIKIWLYDIVKPNQYFSSYEYIKLAQYIIKDIEKRKKTPIFVGGTYFYLKHLLYGFDYKTPPDFKLREKLNKKSVDELQKILLNLNKDVALQMNQSDWQNPRRLIRKIEIFSLKNSSLKSKKEKINIKPKIFIGLKFKNREEAYQKIKQRVEKRINQGAINEAKKLLEMGYKKTDPGLQTIGYKQIIEYLEGKISKEKAIENWITAEIQYTKRQYTFMKKDKNIKWENV
ncbi:MAG: tRNA (adenosine(37)-N6)-dimethylallyltransferase MiaA [Patescibacteria group bacterium]|nr:tRNA (adenosine(37)-N6)-dimethylallyltransferase MiaA [Patescibacteria group bacterium]